MDGKFTRQEYIDLTSQPNHINRPRNDASFFDTWSSLELENSHTRLTSVPLNDGDCLSDTSSTKSHENCNDAINLRPGITQRLGSYLIATNIAALAILVAVVNITTFLWFGNQDNTAWRRIMIGGWVGQTVTLTTLVVRLAISTQAATALAMLASILLEQSGVLLHNAPAASIARYQNNGPLLSLLPFWREARRGKSVFIFCLVAALACTTSLLQLSSTILLWDIRPGFAHGFEETVPAVVGYNLSNILSASVIDSSLLNGIIRHTPNYWTSIPQNFPAFAEWNRAVTHEDSGIADTGPTIRALLPVSSEADRSLLRDYRGMATVFDARVTCVRPDITDLRFSSLFIRGSGTTSTPIPPSFRGRIKPAVTTDELDTVLRFNNNSSGVQFECTAGPEWLNGSSIVHLCGLQYPAGGLINYLDPTNNGTLQHYYDEEDHTWKAKTNEKSNIVWDVELGHAYLLLNYSLNIDGWAEWAYGNLTNQPLSKSKYDFVERDSWADFVNANNTQPLFSATLCFDAMYSYHATRYNHQQDFDIVAERDSNFSEPVIGGNSETSRFFTPELQKQLGATKQNFSTSERGIFGMDISRVNKELQETRSTWTPENSTIHLIGTSLTRYYKSKPQSTYDFLNPLLWRHVEESPLSLLVSCDKCTLFYDSDDPFTFLSSLQSDLFVDVLKETRNPALAMQSLLTSLTRMAYYEWLPTFNVKQDLKIKSFKSCQVPQSHRGFTIVMTTLLIHHILVAIVALLFFKKTRYSMLNNAWQAISQVTSPSTAQMLEQATMIQDKTVRGWLDGSAAGRRRYAIQRIGDGRRVGLE